ncbi:uncharacterized protein N0V89_006195 [Didymosphaeria variabile]|uniref:Major facilitator superfamily (MFS) profile domain-containing protein n=1 Tax=Didymosphaeria variabile TaxID=1932322 RepID=A0A9W9CCF7_9PLEO|nr:uncharacterized protein N0V89_006195 [Didymosphaeria variabile]KAJ4354458.1 hypothetical protein N0V89_006195 [Didymosphaeria variabile]
MDERSRTEKQATQELPTAAPPQPAVTTQTRSPTIKLPPDTPQVEDEPPSTFKQPEAHIPNWRLISLYVSICFGLFLAFLDTSIVATALYTIGVEFQSLSKINWVALAYTLAYLGCTAIFASLSDVFGRRNTYIAASTLFIAFSLGCGWAKDLNQLIAFRALQGVGGSGLYSIGFVILAEISSVKMLRLIGALAGGVIAMSGVLGPVLGGIITNYTTWRWIFWINAPIGILPIILFALAWPNQKQLPPAERRPFRQMDFLGFFLLIAASVPFVFAFQEAGIHVVSNANVWKTAIFVAPLIVGIICWIALFGWEYIISVRWSASINAFLPIRLAKRRVYMSAVAATMLSGFPYFVVIYSLPTHFQVVNDHSALASGIALLPLLGSSAIGSTIAGAVSSKKNNTFPVMITGAVLMVIGTATLSTLGIETQAKAYGLQVFVGLGFGLTIATSSMIAGTESEIRDNAVAQGIMAQVRVFARRRPQAQETGSKIADPALLHTVLGERLGVDGRDQVYRIHNFDSRVHLDFLRLPQAVLPFYIQHFDLIPFPPDLLTIDKLNLVLNQFVGDDPLLAMCELNQEKMGGLPVFCRK